MKKRFSLSRLMHNDRLMMVASLLLAILVWSLVVYGPSNAQDQVITGVPVSVTLNEYVAQATNLRITSGTNATATVTVHGLRSVVSRLTASDITVTADAGSVVKEGTYTLPLRAVSTGDYTIQSVVGEDGTSDTVTITVDVWREKAFPVEVEMPNLKLADERTFQFGTPLISSTAMSDGQITVSGPRSAVTRITTVVAVIKDEAVVNETAVYDGTLEARDEEGNVLDAVSFLNAEDSKVSVTVPVMVYREVQLKPSLLHIPAAYSTRGSSLVTVSPTSVELWGVPDELDDYITSINNAIQVDFDQLNPGNLTKNITLETMDGIRPVNGNETLQVKVGLTSITSRTLDVELPADCLTVNNAPAGTTVTLKQSKLTGITLCGSARSLRQITSANIRLTVDMSNTTTAGQQTVKARVSVDGYDDVWVYYGETAHGVDVLVSVGQ